MLRYESRLKKNARALRGSMTETEVILWSRLRGRQMNGVRFLRQKPIGKYIVDFYCPTKKLVIELDGGQHYDGGESVRRDKERDAFLEKEGLIVLRFTNTDIRTNLLRVLEKIFDAVK